MILSILNFIIPLALSADIPPTTFPVFLKFGFTSVLEFEETPTRVVIGDSQNFQIEKLGRSLAIRSLVSENTSNMFVYFKTLPPKLFILTASDDNQPSYYKKFESLVVPKPVPTLNRPLKTGIISSKFDSKKDYLTIDIVVAARGGRINPRWNATQLRFNSKTVQPTKIWSQRKEIQSDSHAKARFIFYRPDIPKNLANVSLVLPTDGNSIEFKLGGK